MSIYPIILAQNKFPHRDAHYFSTDDRGIQFGDGIYEVIRLYAGKFYLLEEHIDRLFRSAKAIHLSLPFTKEEITERLHKLAELNQMEEDGKLYLQVTRGSAPRSHTFSTDLIPNVYGYLRKLPRQVQRLKEGVAAITHPDTRWDYCYVKSLNLLPNILAKQKAYDQGCYEAILHRSGIVTEGSSSNIFIVRDKKLYTFPATEKILNGCVRTQVITFAENLNIPIFEEEFTLDDLMTADEVFLTSTTNEILPIVTIDQKKIAAGTRGEITKTLQENYERHAKIRKTVHSTTFSEREVAE